MGDGEALHQELLGHYHLQMEMVSADYVLGMTSLMDTDEGMRRLVTTLHEIDEKNRRMAEPSRPLKRTGRRIDGEVPEAGFTARMYRKNPRRMQIYQALDLCRTGRCRLMGSRENGGGLRLPVSARNPAHRAGRSYHGRVYLAHRECRERKLNVEGQGNLAPGRIKIVYF